MSPDRRSNGCGIQERADVHPYCTLSATLPFQSSFDRQAESPSDLLWHLFSCSSLNVEGVPYMCMCVQLK